MATAAEKRNLARQVAERMGRVHTELVFAGFAARSAKLPRATRIDKMAADAALLRDFYAQLAKKV
jgi:hypothetical protein